MGITATIQVLKEIAGHRLNANRKWAAIGDYFAWNIGRRLLAADYVLPMANDAVLILSNRQNYATLSYTCVLWDFEEMLFLTHLLRPGDLFLDIGANVGGYTVLASAVAGANTIAFEPVPSTHAELERNIHVNAIGALAEARQLGLGESDATLSMTADRGGLNHMVARTWAGETIDVPVRRLDDVLAGRTCRLMKVDAEGFEMNIFRGAAATLANPGLCALIVELNGSGLRFGHSDDSVHAEIARYGFRPHRYDPATRRLTEIPTFNRNSLNTLYVRNADDAMQWTSTGPKIRVRSAEF